MGEVFLQSGAKVVQSWFSIGRFDKSVLGTFTVTGEQVFALVAVFRQRGSFRNSKDSL